MKLHEPDAALTDFALALASWELAAWTAPASAACAPAVTVGLTLTGAAALLGGLVHGFWPQDETAGYRWLWPPTIVAVALAATAFWLAGARLLAAGPIPPWFAGLLALRLVATVLASALADWSYRPCLLDSLGAVLLLLAGFVAVALRGGRAAAALGVFGLVVIGVGAVLLRRHLGWPRLRLGHNGLYHVLQGLGLWLLAAAVRALP